MTIFEEYLALLQGPTDEDAVENFLVQYDRFLTRHAHRSNPELEKVILALDWLIVGESRGLSVGKTSTALKSWRRSFDMARQDCSGPDCVFPQRNYQELRGAIERSANMIPATDAKLLTTLVASQQ